MNKRFLILTLSSLLAFPTLAQQKMDAPSIIAIQQMRSSSQQARRVAPHGHAVASPEISVMIKMLPGHVPAEITGAGARVGVKRGEFAVVTLPLDSIDGLAALPGIQCISYKQPMHYCLDKATADMGVDKIHAGTGLQLPYTGKGVVVGVLDNWLDPNHIMFRDATTGESRVKMFLGDDGQVLDTPQQIAAYVPSESERNDDHGTHVTGIAAGAYDDGTFSCNGVATGSDILLGNMTDAAATFMERVEAFTSYSKAHGMPLVINLSYEPMSGAHDGTDPITSYIDRVSADGDAVFCVAVGNAGLYPCCQKVTLGHEGDEMKTVFWNIEYIEDENAGVSLWSNSDEMFTTKIVVVDRVTKEVVASLSPKQVGYTQFDLGAYPDMAKAFSGKISTSANIDQNNNRYNLYMTLDPSLTSLDAERYELGYIITGHQGQTVTAYSLSQPLFDGDGMEGWGDGITSDGAVNDFVCGKEAIAVGSYTTRDAITFADGVTYTLKDNMNINDKCGDVSSFTSFGTLADGRTVPHILAPGAAVISAMSTFYMENDKIYHMPYTHAVTSDGRTYYWTAYPGTSMAAPCVTGIAALWLEADSTLTAREIRDIAMETARRDSFVVNANNQVQCGAGKIDAYAGLTKVLERVAASLGHIDSGKDFIWRAVSDGNYEFFSAGATSLSATVYNMRGEAVSRSHTAGDRLSVSVGSLPKGVYAVSVSDGKGTHTVKIAI